MTAPLDSVGFATFSTGEALERLLERDHQAVSPAGRTLVRLHAGPSANVAVLFHGLTASPRQFVRFADDLYARGFNVLVPRLPRHGHADRLSQTLGDLRIEELEAVATEALGIARGLGARIVVAGFSLGGMLALWLAQREPIDRVVAIAPFLGISWIPNRFMHVVTDWMLRLPNQFHWWDLRLRETQMPVHGYPRFSTHAIGQAYRLARSLFDEAAHAPPRAQSIVLVLNAGEAAVNNRAIRRLYARWHAGAADRVELVELRGLPPSHDIIEPEGAVELAERVYPLLLDLML